MLHIQLPDDSFILLLDIYPKERKIVFIYHRPAHEFMQQHYL